MCPQSGGRWGVNEMLKGVCVCVCVCVYVCIYVCVWCRQTDTIHIWVLKNRHIFRWNFNKINERMKFHSKSHLLAFELHSFFVLLQNEVLSIKYFYKSPSVQFDHLHHHFHVAIALCLLLNDHHNIAPIIIDISSQQCSFSRYKNLNKKILKLNSYQY